MNGHFGSVHHVDVFMSMIGIIFLCVMITWSPYIIIYFTLRFIYKRFIKKEDPMVTEFKRKYYRRHWR